MQTENKSNLTHAENKIGIKQPGKTSIHAIQTYMLIGAVILLAWNKDVITVTNPISRTFTISAIISVASNSTPFLLTTCYGPSDDRRKDEFLAELQTIKPAGAIPWMIIGDFNLIYQAADKSNLNLNRVNSEEHWMIVN